VNWRWIDKRALLLLHDESLAEHGGAAGIRPLNLNAYGTPDFADLAASYAIGLAKKIMPSSTATRGWHFSPPVYSCI
jgi:death-on-curing protein